MATGRARVLAALSAIAACATVAGLRSEPLELGAARTFRTTAEAAVAAARIAFARSDIDLDESSQPDTLTWMLLGTHAGGLVGGRGELVRVVVNRVADSTTVVRVLTRRWDPTDLFAEGDWSRTLFAYIGAIVGDSGVALN